MNLKLARKQIDFLDKQLITILAKRFRIVKKMGVEKKKLRMPIQNIKREKAMIKERVLWLKKNGFFDSFFVKTLFNSIMKKSRELQRR